MQNIVVGSNDCTITDVWSVIISSYIIKEKWTDFAGYLRIPSEDIERHRLDLLHDKINRNDILNKILHRWVAYQGSNAKLEELIRIFEDKCRDNSVGEKLRLAHNLPCKHFQNNLTWAKLSSSFRKKIVESISNYFPNIKLDVVKTKLEGDVLLDLMRGKKPKLFNSIIPPSPKFYLKRTILSRHTISAKVFEADTPDIFLFTGLNEFELGRRVKKHEASTSGKQLDSSFIHIRFMVLEQKNHFKKICERTRAPVHLLSYDNNLGKLKWMQTRGRLSLLQSFVEDSQDPLTEEEFLESIKSISTSPVLISDSPGMGKSFFLANIALELEKGKKIVIFISLNDLIKQIKANSEHNKNAMDSIRDSLQNLICDNVLGKTEFPTIFSASDIKIELLMDGFDEVSVYDMAFALEIIKNIANALKSIRLWITTRPHHLQELEAEFNVLGYNIKAFDDGDQINFLKSHWQHSKLVRDDHDLNPDKVMNYASEILQKIKRQLNKDDNDIAGIPLQCLLIGEVFEEDCIGFVTGSNEFTSRPEIRINSISDLFTNMVAKKFLKYLSCHATPQFEFDNLVAAHVDISLRLLFPAYNPNLDFIQINIKDLLNIGIIQTSGKTDTDFIHRTFAEYFVAGYVIEMLSEGSENYKFERFFLDEILMRKKSILQILPEMDGITTHRFTHNVISNFVNTNILSLDQPSKKIKLPSKKAIKPETRMEIFHACANSSFLQIFKLILNNEYSDINETIILLAIRNSTCEYFKFIMSYVGERVVLFEEQQLSNFLRVAIQRSDLGIIDFLIKNKAFDFQQLITDLNASTKLLLHDCVSNTKYRPEENIEKRVGVIQLLVEINPHLLQMKDGFGRTPLLCEYAHVDLLKELIRLGADVRSQDMKGDTILHLSKNRTRRFNADEYHSLITSIPKQKLTQVLKVVANDKHTPLIRLICLIEPCKETLEILFEERTDPVETVFVEAIANGRNSNTLQNLIKFGVDMKWKGGNDRSYLHVASRYGNSDAVNLLIQNYFFDANILDNNMHTPMDYAIESDLRRGSRFEAAKSLYNLGGGISERVCFKIISIFDKAIKDGNIESVRIIQEILFENITVVESEIESVSRWNQNLPLSEEQFKLLVKNFVDSNKTEYSDSDGHSLLHLAALRGDEVAVKELVENGADLDVKDVYGNTPLHRACLCGDLTIGLRIIKFLINNGANACAMNDDNITFAHRLFCYSSLINISQLHEITEYLAQKNFVSLLFSAHGGPRAVTPLHLACQLRELQDKTITLLIQNGVSFNQLDSDGQDVLMHAIIGGRSKDFLNLIVNKCSVDWALRDKDGRNGLHIAAQCGNIDALKLLIDLGLGINEVDGNKNTPLHYVAKFGMNNILETAKILVDEGVDVKKRNCNGHSVLDLIRLRKPDSKFRFVIRAKFINMLKIRNMDMTNNMTNVTRTFLLLTAPNQSEHVGKNQGFLFYKAIIETRSTYDYLDVIKSLIAKDAGMYEKDQEENTFLYKVISLKQFLPSDLNDISEYYLLDVGSKHYFETPEYTWGATALHYAVQYFEPKRKTLQLFKSHGINFNCFDANGNSLLAYAVTGKRSSEFLSLLINEFGVNWKRLNNSKQNLLHVAAQVGNEHAVKFFLNLELKANAKDLDGNTPIFYAIPSTGDDIISILQLLLNNGADIKAKNNQGHTTLHCTAFMKEQSQILHVIQFLIERGVDVYSVDLDKFTFLHLLVQKRNGSCPITTLAFHELAQYLIKCDYYKLFHSPGGVYDASPAQHAVGNLELGINSLSLLYSNKTDINYRDIEGNSCLFYAISGKRSRRFCQGLVDLGADIKQKNEDGESLLHVSSRFGVSEVVELFVDLGSDANERDSFGRTPLHGAACRDDGDIATEVMKCLIENGADLNLTVANGFSPLHFLVKQSVQNLPLIAYLIDKGANLEKSNNNNSSYIHLAAEFGGVEVLKFFLDMNIFDINSVDRDGNTSLHCAMKQKESSYALKKVQILLEYGADVNIKNNKGQKAVNVIEMRVEWNQSVVRKVSKLLIKRREQKLQRMRCRPALLLRRTWRKSRFMLCMRKTGITNKARNNFAPL